MKPTTPEAILELTLSRFKPEAIFVGFSGGDDSLCATHLMMNLVPGCRVFHLNTGIGIERTRIFVRETCREQGWPLIEIRAKEDCGQDYREIVLKHGFPGPASHHWMYHLLKERCVRKLVAQNKKTHRGKIVIATGLRREESKRRMGKQELFWVAGAQVWVSPIFYWDKQHCHDYIKRHGLKRNPVSEILGMSGECLCGAYAHYGEKALIRQACPETADAIDALESEVRAAGHSWGWEDGPPAGVVEYKRELKQGQTFMPLCVGCEK